MLKLIPPTNRKFVSSGWGRPRKYRGGWHEGLDFPGVVGSPILAAADGIISYVKNVSTSYAGKWIAIDHGNGMLTRYLHNDKNLVTKGQKVKRGEQIATLGTSGTTGKGTPHLHFDVKFGEAAHKEYVEKYGTPTTGWGKASNWGKGVPGETFMSGAAYSDMAKKWAKDRGVAFYVNRGMAVSLVAVTGVGLAYLLWKNK